MQPNTLKRRVFISAAIGLPLLSVHAQVSDLSDAINKAGRQRMLSQRMGKAWLALVHGVEVASAQQVLDKSMALFDRQLVELKAYASTPDIQGTYGKLDAAWSAFKAALVGTTPAREGAAALLQLDERVLALANQGTLQYEAVQGKPLGKLVNIAGRQRMLSQRMAMYFLAARLQVNTAAAAAEVEKSRAEFVSAMAQLRNAPQTTERIRSELDLADGQWVFFNSALQKVNVASNNSTKPLAEVFMASENLLTVMDRVTSLYSAIKT